ncbi:hypothetical protein [Catellatospora sp. NPDC049609]|uniref:hypothetical protein n=1 Tax=Catellatospora sp. NPDC049609 TaxID=3155505 RepID=UPI00343B6105
MNVYEHDARVRAERARKVELFRYLIQEVIDPGLSTRQRGHCPDPGRGVGHCGRVEVGEPGPHRNSAIEPADRRRARHRRTEVVAVLQRISGRRELLPQSVDAVAALVSDRTITW